MQTIKPMEIRSPNYNKTIRSSTWQWWENFSHPAQMLWVNYSYESERVGTWYLQRYDFPCLSMELMLDGELFYESGGDRIKSLPGELHITPLHSEIRVSSTPLKHCRRIGLDITGDILPAIAEKLGLTSEVNFKMAAPEIFTTQCRSLYDMLKNKKDGTESAISALCYQMLCSAAEECHHQESAVHPYKLRMVIDQINSDLGRNWSVNELAEAMGCSIPTLFSIFDEFIGETPMHHIMRLKMQYARQTLLSGRHSIKETAFLLGFKNQFYFSKVYQKFFGEPPSRTKQPVF